MSITLTSQQLEAMELLITFATSKTDRMFLLESYAGTGKSSTWWAFYEKLTSFGQRYFVAVSAPTNKAVGVLQAIAPKNIKEKVEFATIHRLLGRVWL